MTAKILVFPTRRWIFVLVAAVFRRNKKQVVQFTIVDAPSTKEEDEQTLKPYLTHGWSPLIRSTDGERLPIATEWRPGDPLDSFHHAIRTFLPVEQQNEIYEKNLEIEYVPPHTEVRHSS